MGDIGTIIIYVVIAVAIIAVLVYLVRRQSAASKSINDNSRPEAEHSLNESNPVQAVAEEDNDELIAVISAAVAAALGKSITRIKVRSIRRVEPIVPSWTTAGRQDQMNQRF